MSEIPPFEVRRFETLDSTNRYLLDEARRGAPEGLVVVADHQSAGRGRLGRTWEAPAGTNLLASVLLRPVLDPARLHLCTAALALAGADACAEVAGVTPDVKWPNDLVVGEAKLAGVLAEIDAEAPGGPPGSVAVVAGIGINVGWPGPAEAGGTSLLELSGREVGPAELLERLLAGLGVRVELLSTPSGRRRLAEEWRARCGTVGREVRVELADESFEATAIDVDPDGHLVVLVGGHRRVVTAGDVVHLRPANPGSSEGSAGPK